MAAPPALRSFTKLLVLDLEASLSFYRALGFAEVARDGTFVHLRWEAQGDLLLVPVPKNVKVEGKRGWGVLLCFVSQAQTVDSIATKATALDRPVQGPDVMPWHTREAVITDPDGYRLNFIEPASTEDARAHAPSSHQVT